jgi:asparagine synthase (glutamine-hydrolysing)
MCGIVGAIALNEEGKAELYKISSAVYSLQKRGPDDEGIYFHNNVVLAHRRLSIIDTSKGGAQPMTDESGRFTIIFNGEFFNFKEHRTFLQNKGVTLRSESDTEVLLQLYILEKEKCLDRINGFFSLAVYDQQEEELFLARDRFGVKPLLIYEDENNLFFSSEMKGLENFGIKKEIDHASLLAYFQLNYIPSPWSVYRHVRKMVPGTFLKYSLKRQAIIEERHFY